MKLDRNINSDGRGKYALIRIRELDGFSKDGKVWGAIETLQRAGIICWGNETPGDQFFVMKYKDKFTAPALEAYADAVLKTPEPPSESLLEWSSEVHREAQQAKQLGKDIPS